MPLLKYAVPAALLPPPPLKTTVGADVYPLPPFVILTPVTPSNPYPGKPLTRVLPALSNKNG